MQTRDLVPLVTCEKSIGQLMAVVVSATILTMVAPSRTVAAQSPALRVKIGSRVRATVRAEWVDLTRGVYTSQVCDESVVLRPGLTSWSGSRCRTMFEGGLVERSAESLVLGHEGVRIVLRPEDLQLFEVGRVRRTDAGKGAKSGFIIGAALGGVARCSVHDCEPGDRSLLIFAPVGGLLGAMIGALIGAEHVEVEWEVVNIDALYEASAASDGFTLFMRLSPKWLP